MSELIEVNGSKFVAGLFWQLLSKPRARQVKDDIRLRAKKFGSLFVLRNEGVLQAGFCKEETGRGIKPGCYSLAASLARARGGNWLGAFHVGNGIYVYFAMRDDCILPNGDSIGSEDEIRARMAADYPSGRWDAIFSPSSWQFGGQEEVLESLLPKKLSANDKIKTTERKNAIVWGVRGIFAAAGVAAAYIAYTDYRNEQEKAELARQVATHKAGMDAPAEKQVVLPWQQHVRPSEFAHHCINAIERMPPFVAGWQAIEMLCVNGQLQVKMTRIPPSTIDDLYKVFNSISIEPNGDNATAAIDIRLPPAEGVDVDLPAKVDVLRRLVSAFQSAGVMMQLADETNTALPGANQDSPPPWIKQTFSFSSTINPRGFARMLEVVPTARIRTISFKPSEYLWHLSGDIYERNS